MRRREMRYGRQVEVINLNMSEKASTAHPECVLIEDRCVGREGEISQIFNEKDGWSGWCGSPKRSPQS